MKVHSILTGNLKLDGGAMFGVVPKILWQKVYPADENNLCNWAMRCMLVEDADKRILIDTGAGDKQREKFAGLYHFNGDASLLKSLSDIGCHADDITDVVITHLHFDHVGGAIRYNNDKTKTELTFQNAQYWISEKQWELAKNPNRRERASLLKENIFPIEQSGHLNFVKNDIQLFPHVSLKFFYGHTYGQIIPYIDYKSSKIIFLADLMPSIAHIPLSYNMGYDNNPLVTIQEKDQLLSEAAEKKYILFFEHDLYNECCTVERTEKGFKAEKTFSLKEIFV
jgi:glyoxylase-like metal-dependent hydrolase (beta-lactamase superfamily II)